jgi:FHS family L-fucose permease-like MFS transporter
MAMPAAAVIGWRGYKFAILCGLLLFAAGALLVIPSTMADSFYFFLAAIFVIASGLAVLETAANPYVTLLGDPARAARRLNLSQSFNGLGQFVAPLMAASLLFSPEVFDSGQAPVRTIYAAIATVVILVAVVTWRTEMPDSGAAGNGLEDLSSPGNAALWSRPRFAWGVVAQFCYVAAQVGVGAFFINYATEQYADITSADAARLLAIGMLCFLTGRFAGTALMSRIAPERLLTGYAIVNVILALIVVAGIARLSLVALVAVFFFMSIMFPTIFALAIRNLGAQTKRGSSFLVMSIVGGAIVPYLMGWIADVRGIALAFTVPVACFVVVAGYGWKLCRPWKTNT